MSAPIILLKEGTEQQQGKRQLLSNIQACQVVADSIRTTLGPRGLDKLIVEGTVYHDATTGENGFRFNLYPEGLGPPPREGDVGSIFNGNK